MRLGAKQTSRRGRCACCGTFGGRGRMLFYLAIRFPVRSLAGPSAWDKDYN